MANTYSIDLEAGSSQYLSCLDSTSLSITGDMTIEFWTKRESVGGSYTVLSKWRDGGTNNSYGLEFNSNNDLVAYISSTGSAYTGKAFVNSDVNTTGVWYHVAFVYTASTGGGECYINGSSVGTVTGFPTSIYNGTDPFWIGRDQTYNQYYDGLIDEVRVWNDVRTAGEISANYQQELVGNEANLVAYWKLNNALTDSTSSGNTLTNNGTAVFSTDVPFSGVVGPANLKSYNTNLSANIKSIDTNLIANVKSLNTNV